MAKEKFNEESYQYDQERLVDAQSATNAIISLPLYMTFTLIFLSSLLFYFYSHKKLIGIKIISSVSVSGH